MRVDLNIGSRNGEGPGVRLEEVALLHEACLPNATTTRLGIGFLGSLYRYFEKSESELLVVAQGDDGLAGCAVLSFEPKDVGKRLIFGTSILPSAILRPRILFKLAAGSGGSDPEDASCSDGQTNPELLYIFTDATYRGRGVGKRLVAELDAQMRTLHLNSYVTATLDDPENPAIEFYRKSGFTPVASVVRHGRQFATLKRRLISAGNECERVQS